MSQRVVVNVDDRPGLPGQLVGSGHTILSRLAGGQQAEQWTMQVTGAVDDTAYAWTLTDDEAVLDFPQTITSGTGETAASIAQLIADKINQDLDTGGWVRASTGGTDTVTVDARSGNYAFTLSESDSNLGAPVNTQEPAEAQAIPFGVGVVENAEGQCALPSTTNLPQQVYTYDPTVANDQEYAGTIVMRHGGKSYPWSFISDGTATAAEVAAGITGAINTAVDPDSGVEASGATDVVTITGEIAGQGFDVLMGSGQGELLQTVPSSENKWLGVSVHTHAFEQTSISDPTAQYPGREEVGICRSGGIIQVLVESGQNPAAGGKVYCRSVASASEQAGAFRTDDDSGDAFIVPGARYKGAAFTAINGKRVAEIELELVSAAS